MLRLTMCVTSVLLLQFMSDEGESLVSWISRFPPSFPSLVQHHTANTRKLGVHVGRDHTVCVLSNWKCMVLLQLLQWQCTKINYGLLRRKGLLSELIQATTVLCTPDTITFTICLCLPSITMSWQYLVCNLTCLEPLCMLKHVLH